MIDLPFASEVHACRLAQAAWATLPVRERLQAIRELRFRLVEEIDMLTAAIHTDIGRTLDDLVGTDFLPTASGLKWLEQNAVRVLQPERIGFGQRPLWLFGECSTIHRRPHGVVGIIGTWNYPVFLNVGQIAWALTAGNGILWKPSELTPRFAEALRAIFDRLGLPGGLMQALPATREAGPHLAEAAIDYVVFTGSAEVGRKLARRLGERLVSSTLELSGCDALFLLEDGDLEAAARATWFGCTINKGQTCIAIRRAFVPAAREKEFGDLLAGWARASAPMTLALRGQIEYTERLLQEALTEGAELVRSAAPDLDACTMAPTVVRHARSEMAICREATFAPVVSVIPYQHLDDAVRGCALSPYGLGGAIFSANTAQAKQLAARLPIGMVTINDALFPTAQPATPFGGRGASGWGETKGADGLLAMTVPQVISVRRGRFRPHFDMSAGPNPIVTRMLLGLTRCLYGRHFGTRRRGFWQMLRNAVRVRPTPPRSAPMEEIAVPG